MRAFRSSVEVNENFNRLSFEALKPEMNITLRTSASARTRRQHPSVSPSRIGINSKSCACFVLRSSCSTFTKPGYGWFSNVRIIFAVFCIYLPPSHWREYSIFIIKNQASLNYLSCIIVLACPPTRPP